MTGSTGNNASATTAPRLFAAGELREGGEIAASAEQAHYLGNVLRRASGDIVRVFNGADGEWIARIAFSRRDRAVLRIESQTRIQQPETGPWLLFGLLKRDATDLVVRQAVELGASRIIPVITERTNAARVNEQRLHAIAIEAAEQSERLTIPLVDPPARLDSVLSKWPAGRLLFVAFERSWPGIPQAAPLGAPQAAPQAAPPGDAAPNTRLAALLIGPEGGFTRGEQEMLRRLEFVTSLSLGPFVLRAETAAAAGQALLLGMGWAEYVTPNVTPDLTSHPTPT